MGVSCQHAPNQRGRRDKPLQLFVRLVDAGRLGRAGCETAVRVERDAPRPDALHSGAGQRGDVRNLLWLFGPYIDYPHSGAQVWKTFTPYAVLVVVLTVMNVYLFILPMAMRM